MLSLGSSHTGQDELWMRPSHLPLAIPPRCLGSGGANVQCRVGRAPTQPKGPHAAQVSWLGPYNTYSVWERTQQVIASLLWANLGKDKGSTRGALAGTHKNTPLAPFASPNGEPPPGMLHSPASGKTNV